MIKPHHEPPPVTLDLCHLQRLRVEDVARVLRLDARHGLSLHVHWTGADPWPVRPPQVGQQLRVPVSGRVPFVEPGRPAG